LLHKSRENSQHPQIVEFLRSKHMFPENQPQHRNLWSAIWIVNNFYFVFSEKEKSFCYLIFEHVDKELRTETNKQETMEDRPGVTFVMSIPRDSHQSRVQSTTAVSAFPLGGPP